MANFKIPAGATTSEVAVQWAAHFGFTSPSKIAKAADGKVIWVVVPRYGCATLGLPLDSNPSERDVRERALNAILARGELQDGTGMGKSSRYEKLRKSPQMNR
ncbi:MAG: hypothetical protein LBJ83_01735 [Oscillospiraceae bacterium]|nr:hypothetical protein [Oscillospiraceae bacterium]